MALWRWSGVALFEELSSRGYLFQSLLTLGGRRLGPGLALGITSVGFGLLHQSATPFATFALIVIGVELGVAYLVTEEPRSQTSTFRTETISS
jgi:membrane protease YdiL (CAAX protease family)